MWILKSKLMAVSATVLFVLLHIFCFHYQSDMDKLQRVFPVFRLNKSFK